MDRAELNRRHLEREMAPFKERLLEMTNKCGYGTLVMTLVPDEEDIELLTKHCEAVKAFRDLMRNEVYPHNDSDDYSYDETDFDGFCLGYLMAKGVPPMDAFLLSTILRYNLQYFSPDLEARAASG